MENLPFYIPLIFGLTTILTAALFYKATNYSKATLLIILSWLALQTLVGLSDFYKVTDTIPPRFLLLVLPPLFLIIGIFVSSKGREIIDRWDAKTLTLLHVVRIPVEIVLFWLFMNKTIPELMTFEGRNYDILSGITAPLVFYFGYKTKQLDRKFILIWNFICLGLLINIVANAILSAPFPFQLFAFEQPNVAVLYFPFIWLPCCIVPLVLLSHLSTLRQMVVNGRIHT